MHVLIAFTVMLGAAQAGFLHHGYPEWHHGHHYVHIKHPAPWTSHSPPEWKKEESASFKFSHEVEGKGGKHSREESSKDGEVEGSYEISLDNGRMRKVKYTAGKQGFKATVDTNEPGTAAKNPADVVFNVKATEKEPEEPKKEPEEPKKEPEKPKKEPEEPKEWDKTPKEWHHLTKVWHEPHKVWHPHHFVHIPIHKPWYHNEHHHGHHYNHWW